MTTIAFLGALVAIATAGTGCRDTSPPSDCTLGKSGEWSLECSMIDASADADFQATLSRSRTPGGSDPASGVRVPQSLPPGDRTGVERGGDAACAPPVPSALAGAVDPRHAAPARLHNGYSGGGS